MSTQPNPHIGSSFDAFLAEEGMLEACEEQAIKELVAEQIARAMREQGLTRTAMAARMRTSRAALNRLLDPTNASVTLQTLQKAAQVIGKRLRLELVDAAEYSCRHAILCQFLQQRPGLLEVGGVKAFSEPAVDRGQ
jgi:transcriptional regulator with XRE-family HTH domain